MEGIKPLKFTGNLEDELRRLKLTERELQGVRKARRRCNRSCCPIRSGVGRPCISGLWMIGKTRRSAIGGRSRRASTRPTRHTRRFFANAGAAALRWGMVAGGIGSGAYAAGVVGKAGIKAAATAQREGARDYLAGMTPEDSQRIEEEALRASRKYQSVDSQTMHERLRDTAMGMRSTDKAIELADTIGQMTTVLQSLKGKDASDRGRPQVLLRAGRPRQEHRPEGGQGSGRRLYQGARCGRRRHGPRRHAYDGAAVSRRWRYPVQPILDDDGARPRSRPWRSSTRHRARIRAVAEHRRASHRDVKGGAAGVRPTRQERQLHRQPYGDERSGQVGVGKAHAGASEKGS